MDLQPATCNLPPAPITLNYLVRPPINFYNVAVMNQSQLVAMQLQRRDPTAWTALLRECLNAEDVVVTAVSAEPIHYPSQRSKLTRYLLALDNHTDPIALIGPDLTGGRNKAMDDELASSALLSGLALAPHHPQKSAKSAD